jgi:hypothetical protein
LLHHHYFNFVYTGEVEKIDEIKNELKTLISERIKLDEYLFLKRPLSTDKSKSIENDKNKFRS